MALKEGKTIESTNSFHFEGSDIVFRYATLTGISRASKMGQFLQEIWTPDVKAAASGFDMRDRAGAIGSESRDEDRGSGPLTDRGDEQERRAPEWRDPEGNELVCKEHDSGSDQPEGPTGDWNPGDAGKGRVNPRRQVPPRALRRDYRASSFSRPQSGPSPSPPHRPSPPIIINTSPVSRYALQPESFKFGAQSAFHVLRDNFHSTAQTILAAPLEVFNEVCSQPISPPVSS